MLILLQCDMTFFSSSGWLVCENGGKMIWVLYIRSIICSTYVYTMFLKCVQGIDTYTPLLVSINMRGIQIYVFLYCKSISLLILSLSLDFIWSLSLICSTIYILKYVLLITYFHVRLLSLHNNEHAHFFWIDNVLIYLI